MMKTQILNSLLLPISLLAACSGQLARTRDFIPGTYVNHAQSNYSIADDTIQITPGTTENTYHILRKTGFRRIRDSKLQAPEHKVKSFTGLWDAQKQTLQLTQNGTVLLFQPDSAQLVVENSAYRKLEEGL